jgi:hypothetical protein
MTRRSEGRLLGRGSTFILWGTAKSPRGGANCSDILGVPSAILPHEQLACAEARSVITINSDVKLVSEATSLTERAMGIR